MFLERIGAEPPAMGKTRQPIPSGSKGLSRWGTVGDTPHWTGILHTLGKGRCLLRLSSSSVFVVPGLRYLKGARKVDNMLTLSGKKRRTGNALLTSSFRKTQCFHMFLLLRGRTREVERSFWFQTLHSGSVFLLNCWQHFIKFLSPFNLKLYDFHLSSLIFGLFPAFVPYPSKL
jgi:hypothetical protein